MGYTAMEKVNKEFTDEQIEKFDRKLLREREKELRNIANKRKVCHLPACAFRFTYCISYNKAYHNAQSTPSAPPSNASKQGPYTFTHFHFNSKDEVVEFFKKPDLYSGLTHFSVSAHYHRDEAPIWELLNSVNPALLTDYKYDSASQLFVDTNRDEYLPIRFRSTSFSKKQNC